MDGWVFSGWRLQGVTEEYERQLWEELNKLLADAIPAAASGDDAVNAMVSLVNGVDTEIAELYAQVRTIAWEQSESAEIRAPSAGGFLQELVARWE